MGPEITDIAQPGASEASRDVLETLKEGGHIQDFIDGYRLGIAVAIAFGREPRAARGSDRTTMFSASTLDADLSLKTTICELYPEARTWPYRAAEDLAEQGLAIIRDSLDGDVPWFGEIVERARAANAGEPGRG